MAAPPPAPPPAPPHVLLLAPPLALLTLAPALLPPAEHPRPRPAMDQVEEPSLVDSQWDFEDASDEGAGAGAGAVPGEVEALRAQEPAALPASAPTPVEAPLDALMDWVLGVAVLELGRNGSSLPLPNFERTFRSKIAGISTRGSFTAREGTVGDVRTLYRAGPVTVLRDGDALLLHAAAGLRTVELRYANYSASYGRIAVSGALEADASLAVVTARVALERPCGVRVHGMALSYSGPLQVRASGLGPLSRLVPLVSRWLDYRLRADVLRIVDDQLQQHAKDLLRRFACEY